MPSSKNHCFCSFLQLIKSNVVLSFDGPDKLYAQCRADNPQPLRLGTCAGAEQSTLQCTILQACHQPLYSIKKIGALLQCTGARSNVWSLNQLHVLGRVALKQLIQCMYSNTCNTVIAHASQLGNLGPHPAVGRLLVTPMTIPYASILMHLDAACDLWYNYPTMA